MKHLLPPSLTPCREGKLSFNRTILRPLSELKNSPINRNLTVLAVIALVIVALYILNTKILTTSPLLDPLFVVSIKQRNSRGSGIVVKLLGCQNPFILTNKHVLPYLDKVQLVGEKTSLILTSQIIHASADLERDIAVVPLSKTEFEKIQMLGISLEDVWRQFPKEQAPDQILSIGFPAETGRDLFSDTYNIRDSTLLNKSYQPLSTAFYLSGRVLKSLKIPLKGGYDLLLTHDLRQGMSGGPLINRQNLLVGVNSLHATPAWKTELIHEDGVKATPNSAATFESVSMAIGTQIVYDSIRPYLGRICGYARGPAENAKIFEKSIPPR